jgi:hypothetical protein
MDICVWEPWRSDNYWEEPGRAGQPDRLTTRGSLRSCNTDGNVACPAKTKGVEGVARARSWTEARHLSFVPRHLIPYHLDTAGCIKVMRNKSDPRQAWRVIPVTVPI